MLYPRAVMSVQQAAAVRRAALTAGVLCATLAAHRMAGGGLQVVPTAVLTWASLVLLATLTAVRTTRFTPRGPLAWLGVLVAGQTALHLAMTGAPWAFGVVDHHRTAVVSTAAVLTHLTVAAAWTVVLCGSDALLARACAIGRRLVRAMAPRRAGSSQRGRTLPPPAAVARVARPTAANAVRGPPLIV